MRVAAILLVCLLAKVSAFGQKGGDAVVPHPLQDNISLYVCSHPGAGQGNLVKFDSQTGEWLADLSGVAKPVDADIGPNGDIFVTDAAGGTSNIRRFDHETGEADATAYGDTADLLAPRGLAFGADDHLYVAEMTFIPGEVGVAEFDESGAFVRFLPDDTESPVLLAIEDAACDANGRIYVTQWYYEWYCENPGVFRFTGSGWFLFGETYTLKAPWGLTFGPDGNLYVAEDASSDTAGIYRYDGTTGVFLGVYGQTGSRDKLVHPRYLAFGPDEDLYVVDSQDSTVRKFSGPLKPDAGDYKGVFGETGEENSPSPMGVVFSVPSGPPAKPELLIEGLPNGQMLLTLTGTEGKSYELRYTSDPTVSDFTNWTFGATINLEGTTSESWTDDTAPVASRRFYKAMEQ